MGAQQAKIVDRRVPFWDRDDDTMYEVDRIRVSFVPGFHVEVGGEDLKLQHEGIILRFGDESTRRHHFYSTQWMNVRLAARQRLSF